VNNEITNPSLTIDTNLGSAVSGTGLFVTIAWLSMKTAGLSLMLGAAFSLIVLVANQ
jgi:hypothetical protein